MFELRRGVLSPPFEPIPRFPLNRPASTLVHPLLLNVDCEGERTVAPEKGGQAQLRSRQHEGERRIDYRVGRDLFCGQV